VPSCFNISHHHACLPVPISCAFSPHLHHASSHLRQAVHLPPLPPSMCVMRRQTDAPLCHLLLYLLCSSFPFSQTALRRPWRRVLAGAGQTLRAEGGDVWDGTAQGRAGRAATAAFCARGGTGGVTLRLLFLWGNFCLAPPRISAFLPRHIQRPLHSTASFTASLPSLPPYLLPSSLPL